MSFPENPSSKLIVELSEEQQELLAGGFSNSGEVVHEEYTEYSKTHKTEEDTSPFNSIFMPTFGGNPLNRMAPRIFTGF